MKKFLRCRHGFTLMELLAVVSITLVLAVITAAALGSLQKETEYSRLSGSAKEIFLAAQNNLTKMHSSGTLTDLRALGGSGGAHAVPSSENAGFPYAESGGQYDYTTSASGDEAAFDLVLPQGSVETALRGGRVLIEYNPTTGSVYSVFYSEGSSSLTYGNLSRDAAFCKKNKIGYYAGSLSVAETVAGTAFSAFDFKKEELLFPVLLRKEAAA
jgi:prepilin-type N-terminal cleavage/methylation domain-containing protein